MMATIIGDRTNFSRLAYAIIDKVTPILRRVLNSEISPRDVLSKLKAVKGKKVPINQDQNEVIKQSVNIPDYAEYDITLLYTLIRNFCKKLQPPTNGWGDNELPEEVNIEDGDDIERIRIIRNKVLGHVAKASIPQNVFEEYWSILEDVCSRLGPKFVPNYDIADFKQVKTCSMDEEMENEYIEKLQTYEIELSERMNKVEQNVEVVKDRMENIQTEVKDRFCRIESDISNINNLMPTVEASVKEVLIGITMKCENEIGLDHNRSEVFLSNTRDILAAVVEELNDMSIDETKRLYNTFQSRGTTVFQREEHNFITNIQSRVKSKLSFKTTYEANVDLGTIVHFFGLVTQLVKRYNSKISVKDSGFTLVMCFKTMENFAAYKNDYDKEHFHKLMADALLSPSYFDRFGLQRKETVLQIKEIELESHMKTGLKRKHSDEPFLSLHEDGLQHICSHEGSSEVDAEENTELPFDIGKQMEKIEILSDQEDDDGIDCGLSLRPYQKELAEVAIEGHNTVVFAETGAGKTRVAYYIIKEHLQKNPNGHAAFLANHNFLVNQHFKVLQELLPEYKETSTKLSGQMAQRKELHHLVKSHHIIVMTPQLIENTIETKSNIHMLSEFSLVILDECHHTYKDHVFNRLMTYYHMEREENQRLPQIVGLTSSFGTGKAKNVDDAKNHILNIMASLDVTQLSVVRRSTESYGLYTRTVHTDIRRLGVQLKDPISKAIEEAISKTEHLLTESSGNDKDVQNALLDNLCRIPEIKNSDGYKHWVTELQDKCIPLLKINENVKAIKLHCEFLKVYSDVLEINESVRGKYALQGLTGRLEREHLDTPCGETLYDKGVSIAKDLQEELKWLSDEEIPGGKDVDKLLMIIRERMETIKTTSIIVFVKTRELCTLLAEYLTSEGYEFRSFTGHTSGPDNYGTSIGNQQTILSAFNEGKITGIISTTIADEGLDIPNCDCVIFYKYIGNEISSKQAKGRMRKRQGDSLLIGRQQQIVKDTLNIQRLLLMECALELVLNMQNKDLRPEIVERQRQLVLRERRRRNQAASQVKDKSDEYVLVCKRCGKNDISCTKIRTIHGKHHAVVDKNIWKKINEKPLKKVPRVDDFTPQTEWFHDNCTEKQGTVFVYENVRLPVLSQSRVLYYRKDEHPPNTKPFKTWKDLPCEFKEIKEDDLQNMV